MFKGSNFSLIIYLILCFKWSQGSDSHTNYRPTNLRNKYTPSSAPTTPTSTTVRSTTTEETTVAFQQVDQNGYAVYNTDYQMHNQQGGVQNGPEKTQTVLRIVDTQNRSEIFNQNGTLETVINILAQEMDSGHETIGPNTTESLAKITLMPKTGKASTIEVNGNLLSDFLHMKQFGMVKNDTILNNFPIYKSKDTFSNDTLKFSNEYRTPLDTVKFNMKNISDEKTYNNTENTILPSLPTTSDKVKETDKQDQYLLTNSKNKYKNIKRNLHKFFNNIMKNKKKQFQTMSEALIRLSEISDYINHNSWKSLYLNPHLYNWRNIHPLNMLTNHNNRLTLSEEVLLKLLLKEFKLHLIENDTFTETATENTLEITKSMIKNSKFEGNEKYQKQITRNFMASNSNTENTEQVLNKEMCETIGICDNDTKKNNINEKEAIGTVRRLILHLLEYLKNVKNHISTKNSSRFVSVSEKLKKIIDHELGNDFKLPKKINITKKNLNAKSIKKNISFSKNKKSVLKPSPKKYVPPEAVKKGTIKDDNIFNDTYNTPTLLTNTKTEKTKSHAHSEASVVVVEDKDNLKNEINETNFLMFHVSNPAITNNVTQNSSHVSQITDFSEHKNNLRTYHELETQIDHFNNSHVDSNQKIFFILNYLANLTKYHKNIENYNFKKLRNLENNLLFNEYYINGLELIKNLINISVENFNEFPSMLRGLEILENNLITEEYNTNDKREKETLNFCSYFTNRANSGRTNIEKESTVSKMDIVNYIIRNKLIQLAQNMCTKERDVSDILFKKEKRAKRYIMDSLEDENNLKENKMHRSLFSNEAEDLYPMVEGIREVHDNNERVTEQIEDSYFGSMGVPGSAELTYNNYI